MSLAAKHKSFFLWTLRFDPKSLSEKIRFFPAALQKQFEDLEKKTQSLQEEELKKFALRELKKFGRSFHRSYLPQVHNDWIVEKLQKESPHMVSAILRNLPADRVRQILNRLPSELLTKLPKLSESYAMSSGLSEALKRRFEGYFEMTKVYDSSRPFEFQSLCYLKPILLKKVFQELGYREIALGLKLLPEKTKTLVLGRLLPKDRVEVEKYLKQNKSMSEARHKRAQVHIISQEIEDVTTFILEIGFLVFAKAVLQQDQADIDVIFHKFSRKEARLLKKHLDLYLKQNSEASVLSYREEILNVCRIVLQD